MARKQRTDDLLRSHPGEPYSFGIRGDLQGAIPDGVVTTVNIADLAITAQKIANLTITAAQIANLTITAAQIANATITATQIANLTITAAQIANATITGGKIANTTITAANIVALTITANEIANATITGGKIAAGTITASNILAATITANEIANATITGGKIAAATITGGNIAAATITGGNVGSGTITGGNIAATTITAGNIASLTITGAQIANLTITASQIANLTIDGTKITDLAISTAKIADGAVLTAKLADLNVTLGKLAALSVDTSKLVDGSVLTAKMADLNVTLAKLGSNSVDLSKLFVGSFDNLLLNGNFEQSASGFAPWSTTGYTNNGGTFSLATTNARSTPNALQFDPTGQAAAFTDFGPYPFGASGIKQMPTASAGDQHYFEYWVRKVGTGTAQDVQAAIRYIAADGSNLGGTTGTAVTPTQVYQKVSVTGGVAPANTAYVSVFIRCTNPAGATELLLFDDAYARRMTTGSIIVDGAITTAKVVAGAITANEIAAVTITAAQIAASTITGAKIAASTITAANIAADTITATEIAASAITSSELAAGSVTTAKIVAGAVTANEIAATAITASKLLVSDLSNLVQNPVFQGGSSTGWSSLNSGYSVVAIGSSPATNQPKITHCIKSIPNATPADMFPFDGGYSWFSVTPGEKYYVGAWIATDASYNASNDVRVGLMFADDITGTNSGGWTKAIGPTGASQGWAYYEGQITIPAGRYAAVLWVSTWSTNTGGAAYITGLRLRKTSGSVYIEDGAVTAQKIATHTITANEIFAGTITATEIAASTITGAKIAAGTITATNIATGTITANEIAASTITGAKIAATTIAASNIVAGTITGNEIAASTITAGKLSVATLSAITADLGTITAGLIQDAGATRGLVVTGSVPGGFTRYLNLNGSGSFLKHDKLDMKYDGTASFAGLIDITSPQAALTVVPGFMIMRDPDVAHGATDLVPTDVLGYIAETSTTKGGLYVLGLSSDTSVPGTYIEGIVGGASGITAAIALRGGVKSGTNRTQVAVADLLLSVENGGNPVLKVIGSGRLQLGYGSSIGSNLAPVSQVLFRLKNVTHSNATEGSITGGPYSMTGGTLDVDGAALRVTMTGLTGANNCLPRIKFGATYLDTNPSLGISHNFVWRATIVRTGATTQKAMLERCDNGTWVLERTSPAETLSGSINVDIRSSEVGGATTTFDSVVVELLPA